MVGMTTQSNAIDHLGPKAQRMISTFNKAWTPKEFSELKELEFVEDKEGVAMLIREWNNCSKRFVH